MGGFTHEGNTGPPLRLAANILAEKKANSASTAANLSPSNLSETKKPAVTSPPCPPKTPSSTLVLFSSWWPWPTSTAPRSPTSSSGDHPKKSSGTAHPARPLPERQSYPFPSTTRPLTLATPRSCGLRLGYDCSQRTSWQLTDPMALSNQSFSLSWVRCTMSTELQSTTDRKEGTSFLPGETGVEHT